MKKKILSLVLALALIVPAICMLSACDETLYDIEITTTTEIDHVQEIKFSSSSTKKTTYRNSEDTYINVVCDQGYAPDLVFTVGNLQISQYSDYFGEVYDYTTDPAEVTGVRYIYTIPTKDLTGKQSVTYIGGTKTAKIRLAFTLDKGDDVDPFDGDYEGLSFVITDHNNVPIQTFTALQFINFANENNYLFVDYNKEVTITLKSNNRSMNGTVSNVFYIYNEYLKGVESDLNNQLYYSWIVHFNINYELSLNIGWLKQVFPE